MSINYTRFQELRVKKDRGILKVGDIVYFFGISIYTWTEGDETGDYAVVVRFDNGKVNDSPDSLDTKALVSVRDIECDEIFEVV